MTGRYIATFPFNTFYGIVPVIISILFVCCVYLIACLLACLFVCFSSRLPLSAAHVLNVTPRFKAEAPCTSYALRRSKGHYTKQLALNIGSNEDCLQVYGEQDTNQLLFTNTKSKCPYKAMPLVAQAHITPSPALPLPRLHLQPIILSRL